MQVPIPIIVAFIGGIFTIGILIYKGIVTSLNNATKKLEVSLDKVYDSINRLHEELKPLQIKIAEHNVEINNLKTTLSETQKWITHHDSRLLSLERGEHTKKI
jgi:hypothetical protein